MRPTGVVTNLTVTDLDEARAFYSDVLGLAVTAFDLGWVANVQTPDGRAQLQLVTHDATAPVDSAVSVHVGDDIETVYADAVRRGLDIVHPLTTEPWGVRRFFVRDPSGNVLNIVSHVDDSLAGPK